MINISNLITFTKVLFVAPTLPSYMKAPCCWVSRSSTAYLVQQPSLACHQDWLRILVHHLAQHLIHACHLVFNFNKILSAVPFHQHLVPSNILIASVLYSFSVEVLNKILAQKCCLKSSFFFIKGQTVTFSPWKLPWLGSEQNSDNTRSLGGSPIPNFGPAWLRLDWSDGQFSMVLLSGLMTMEYQQFFKQHLYSWTSQAMGKKIIQEPPGVPGYKEPFRCGLPPSLSTIGPLTCPALWVWADLPPPLECLPPHYSTLANPRPLWSTLCYFPLNSTRFNFIQH